MSYVRKSVYRPAGNPGTGIQPRDLLAIYNIDDIAYMPSPDENGVVIVDDIVMKPDRYATEIYMTPGTIEVTSPAEGDPDAVGFKPQIKFNHPGNKREIREFKVNELNSKVIVVVRYCSGQPSDLIGSICNPCTITPSYTGNNEGSSNEFTIAQISRGDDIKIYEGTIALEEPVAAIEAAATTVEFASEGRYQLSGGSAVISSITGGSHGAVITLLGASGTAPTVSSSETILLRNGKVFIASDGSQLTLRAFNAGDDKIIWIEQSRYDRA